MVQKGEAQEIREKLKKENMEKSGWLSSRGCQPQPQGQALEAVVVMKPARSDLGEQRFPKEEVGRQNNQNDQRGWDLYSQLTFLTFLLGFFQLYVTATLT